MVWSVMCVIVVTCVVAASAVPGGAPEWVGVDWLPVIRDAAAQAPPPGVTFHVITDRGNMFEIEPADRAPTTDIVASPYVEFQRVGGLVVSGGVVREAGQYNDVNPGRTYIISNWGDGTTHGIPNGAPLAGELRMDPLPHLYMRTPEELSPGSGIYLPQAISHVETMSGSIVHTNRTHATFGDYHEFRGSGRAIIWLDPTMTYYSINMVCPGCLADTPAVVGGVPDDGGGRPASSTLGTRILLSGTAVPCSISGVNHTGCGETYADKTDSMWLLDPRPNVGGEDGQEKTVLQIPPILNITTYDTTSCPDANHTNTRIEPLNDTLFRVVSDGCIMENYTYDWWDGVVGLEHSLPLRAGLNEWDRPPAPPPPDNPSHPAIILNMRGGQILLQAYGTSSLGINAFENALTVNAGSVVDPNTLVGSNSLVILHDSFAHLGAYTRSNLRDMADHIQTYPHLMTNSTMSQAAHSTGTVSGEPGGLLGGYCLDQTYHYCITIFDDMDLPVIHNAAGIVYDPRNGAELNRGTDVSNHGRVFVTSLPPTPTLGLIPYRTGVLTLVQAYAVIPVSGHINVEELYVMAGYGGAFGCDRYVDDSVKPNRWSAPWSPGWMRLHYLEGDYGDAHTRINIPLLPLYDTVCMKTHGRDEFRQFRTENFFVVGDSASFGGTKHIMTYSDTHLLGPPSHTFTHTVLNTDVVLPGRGVRVMDMDLNVDVSLMLSSVVDGGGGNVPHSPSLTSNDRATICDWGDDSYPVWNSTSRTRSVTSGDPTARVWVVANIQIPSVGGGYETVDIPVMSGTAPLTADGGHLPMTVGANCMEHAVVTWDFDPVYKTIPIEYGGNEPVSITVQTRVDLTNFKIPAYANSLADETIFIETYIDRLSMRVH